MPSSKRTKEPKEATKDTSTGTELRDWLQSLIEFLGNGGLTYAAGRVGMTPSGLLKLLKRSSGFHEPTLHCVALLLENKAERYPDAEVVSSQRIGKYVFENRRVGEDIVPTWRLSTDDEI